MIHNIEGFDFIDEEGYTVYLSKMNEMQQLEPNAFDGIDVYFLNLKNPYRDLRDNAMSVFGVLQYLNSNNGYNEGTRIFGFSMGGVLARYALAFAEHYDIQHYCSQLVSFDSPNQGAVLNESLQSRVIAIYNDLVWKETVENAVWWILWIGDFRDRVKAGKALVKPYIDAINSVAAKQLLRNNIGSSNYVNYAIGSNDYIDFFKEINEESRDYKQHWAMNSTINRAT